MASLPKHETLIARSFRHHGLTTTAVRLSSINLNGYNIRSTPVVTGGAHLLWIKRMSEISALRPLSLLAGLTRVAHMPRSF